MTENTKAKDLDLKQNPVARSPTPSDEDLPDGGPSFQDIIISDIKAKSWRDLRERKDVEFYIEAGPRDSRPNHNGHFRRVYRCKKPKVRKQKPKCKMKERAFDKTGIEGDGPPKRWVKKERKGEDGKEEKPEQPDLRPFSPMGREVKRICRRCGKPGHAELFCTLPKHARDKRVAGVKIHRFRGASGPILDYFDANGYGRPPHRPPSPPPPRGPQPSGRGDKKDDDYVLAYRDPRTAGWARCCQMLKARAKGLLAVRDLASRVDRVAVMKSLYLYISQEHMEPYYIDGVWYRPTDVIPEIMERAFEEVVKERLYLGRSLSYHCINPSTSFIYGLRGSPMVYYPSANSVEYINQLEQLKPYGSMVDLLAIVKHHKSSFYCHTIGLISRYSIFAACEELFKKYFIKLMLWLTPQVPILSRVPKVSGAVKSCFNFMSSYVPKIVSQSSYLKDGYMLAVKYSPTIERQFMDFSTLGSMIGTFGGSIILSALESTGKTWTEFGLRFGAHLLFSTLGWQGLLLHAGFNIMLHYTSMNQYALNLVDHIIPDTCLSHNQIKSVELNKNFKVRYGQAVCKAKFGLRRAFQIGTYLPIIHRQCSHNEKIGLEGRVGKALPMNLEGREDQVSRRWTFAYKKHMDFLVYAIGKVKKPMPFEAWLTSFTPERRKLLKEIHDKGYAHNKAIASSFIKREALIRNTLEDVVEKDCRIIQGCPLELSVQCGPWIRKLAKRISSGLRPIAFTTGENLMGYQIIYTCGMSAEQMGEAFSNSYNLIESMTIPNDRIVIVEDDQSRFDLHLSKGSFRFLNLLYKQLLVQRVAKLLRRDGRSKGRTVLGTKYSIPYTMQSGWPDTSCADTMVNALLKYDIHGRGKPWISLINGDDSITLMSEALYVELGETQGLRDKYSEFGMEVEIKLRTNVFNVDFCSSRFYPTTQGYVLMPKIGRLLAKIGFDHKQRTEEDHMAWVRGIAIMLNNYGRYDPMLCALGMRLQHLVGIGKVIHDPIYYSEYKYRPDGTGENTEEHVLQYYLETYNMGTTDIRDCINSLNTITIGSTVNNALLDRMVAIDLAE